MKWNNIVEGDPHIIQWCNKNHVPGCRPINEVLGEGGNAKIPQYFINSPLSTLLAHSKDYGKPRANRDCSLYMIVYNDNQPKYIGKPQQLKGHRRQHTNNGIFSESDGDKMMVLMINLTDQEALDMEKLLHDWLNEE